ncbi:MAG: hypothetical protein QRY74_02470 [Chlamydia sp.]
MNIVSSTSRFISSWCSEKKERVSQFLNSEKGRRTIVIAKVAFMVLNLVVAIGVAIAVTPFIGPFGAGFIAPIIMIPSVLLYNKSFSSQGICEQLFP